MSAPGSVETKPRGYWLSLFIPIMEGKVPYEKSEFNAHAISLLDFRRDSPNALCKKLESNLQGLIDTFFDDNQKLKGFSELHERVHLLSSPFLKALVDVEESLLDEEEKAYVDNCSVYGAFKSSKILDLYNTKVGLWAKEFVKASLFKETIVHNVAAVRGLPVEQGLELVDKHLTVSDPWYEHYLSKKVSLSDVKPLRYDLLVRTNPLTPLVKHSLECVLEMKNEYPIENHDLYMNAVVVELNLVIKMDKFLNSLGDRLYGDSLDLSALALLQEKHTQLDDEFQSALHASRNGLSEKRVKKLSNQYIRKLSALYFGVTLNKISIDQIKALRYHLLAQKPLVPEMAIAKEGYINLQNEYPEGENREAYMKSALSNLKTFIQKVN